VGFVGAFFAAAVAAFTAGAEFDFTGSALVSSFAGLSSLTAMSEAFASGADGGVWFASDDGATEVTTGAAGAVVVAAPLNGIGGLTGAVRCVETK